MTPNSTITDLHPGMMGDGTEEQNLGQTGNPSARISQDEVEDAFAGADGGRRAGEARSFTDAAQDVAEDLKDDAAEGWNSLKDRAATVRDQVAGSADAVRGWAATKADRARQTAAEKPGLVLSVSAGAALAVGLGLGFLLGRASVDYDF